MEQKKYNINEEKIYNLNLFARYETAISNDFFRALGVLRKIQADRITK